MSQRLSCVSDHQAQGIAKGIIEGSSVLLGRTSKLVRILSAHTPYLARWFLGFVAAVRQPSAGAVSDERLQNLATIKTSMVNACNYYTAHSSIHGEALGFAQARFSELGDAERRRNSPGPVSAASWALAPFGETPMRVRQRTI